MKKVIFLASIATVLFPGVAFAHEATGSGFMAGVSHPVLGFDHLLAMLSVGVLSAQMGGRSLWLVPAAFVVVMLVGGVLGMNGIPLFSVETGISLSVLALGLALTVEKKLGAVLAMVFVGFFAVFHGYAHGTEMPNLANPMHYAVGFIIGTASIHAAGVMIGEAAKLIPDGKQLLRYLGAGIAGIGFHLMVI